MKKLFTRIVFAAFVLVPLSSFAAVDAAVTTAITGAGTDAATIGAAVLVVLVGIAGFKYLRKTL